MELRVELLITHIGASVITGMTENQGEFTARVSEADATAAKVGDKAIVTCTLEVDPPEATCDIVNATFKATSYTVEILSKGFFDVVVVMPPKDYSFRQR